MVSMSTEADKVLFWKYTTILEMVLLSASFSLIYTGEMSPFWKYPVIGTGETSSGRNASSSSSVHDTPFAPDQPALHVQLLKAVLCNNELEFAGQLLQFASPAALLYLPVPHAVHVPPFAPHQPALQVQLFTAVLCSGELEPAGQQLQFASPAVLLYLPATHAVHAPPSAPDQPTLQAHLVKAELPTSELEFDGQLLHRADPVDDLYFPATHAVHVPVPASPP